MSMQGQELAGLALLIEVYPNLRTVLIDNLSVDDDVDIELLMQFELFLEFYPSIANMCFGIADKPDNQGQSQRWQETL